MGKLKGAALTGAVLALVLVALSACEPWPLVAYENHTPYRVSIYLGGEYALTLEPDQTRRVTTLEKQWRPDVKAITDDGLVVLEENISWDKLRSQGSRIVITASATPIPR